MRFSILIIIFISIVGAEQLSPSTIDLLTPYYMELKEEYSPTIDSTVRAESKKALFDSDINERNIREYPNFFIYNLKSSISVYNSLRKDRSYIHILISLIDYRREPYTTQQLREEFDTMKYVFPRGHFFQARCYYTNQLIQPHLDFLLTAFRDKWLRYSIGRVDTASWEQYSDEIKSRVLIQLGMTNILFQ